MQIEAVNCQGLNAATDVMGVCLVPEYQSAGSTSANLIAVIIPIVVLILTLIALVIIYQKR